MANRLGDLLHHLRKIALGRDGAGLTDARLLDCYVKDQDDAAFAALVRRHGLLVWDVCMRILRDHHDAEDAFQATFLVLARKAHTLREPHMLANWLYGVAQRAALKAKGVRARWRERQVAVMPEPMSQISREPWSDLAPILDAEIGGLPDKYRIAVILCDLEGRTRQEAARELGIPEGTVASRLARGRQLLAKRLTRRGVTISAAGLATVLTVKASACVPDAVISATIKAAALFAAGQTAGALSASAVALTQGVLTAMFMSKLIRVTAIILVLGATGFGASVLTYQMAQGGGRGGAGLTKGPGDEKHVNVAIPQPDPQKAKDDPVPKVQDAKIDTLLVEVIKLREELATALKEIKALKEGQGTQPGKREQTYKGKPTSYWVDKLNDADSDFRMEAFAAIAALTRKDKILVPIYTSAFLNESEGAVHPDTARAVLGNNKAIVPICLETLKNSESGWSAKYKSINLLASITDWSDPEARTAVPLLIECLKKIQNDYDYYLWNDAVATLGQIGPLAKPAIPTVASCLDALIKKNQQTLKWKSEGQKDVDRCINLTYTGAALAQIDPQLKELIPTTPGETEMELKGWQKLHNALVQKYKAP